MERGDGVHEGGSVLAPRNLTARPNAFFHRPQATMCCSPPATRTSATSLPRWGQPGPCGAVSRARRGCGRAFLSGRGSPRKQENTTCHEGCRPGGRGACHEGGRPRWGGREGPAREWGVRCTDVPPTCRRRPRAPTLCQVCDFGLRCGAARKRLRKRNRNSYAGANSCGAPRPTRCGPATAGAAATPSCSPLTHPERVAGGLPGARMAVQHAWCSPLAPAAAHTDALELPSLRSRPTAACCPGRPSRHAPTAPSPTCESPAAELALRSDPWPAV
jgi:hypothetical protein